MTVAEYDSKENSRIIERYVEKKYLIIWINLSNNISKTTPDKLISNVVFRL